MNCPTGREAMQSRSLLIFAPGDFHAHVVVAPNIPAIHKPHSTQGISPEIPAPVCHLISVCPAQIIDQQVLATGSKGFDTNATYVDNLNNVVIVVVCKNNSQLHSTTIKRHVTSFVEKARFETRTLRTKAERYDHCATRPVVVVCISIGKVLEVGIM